MWPAGDYNAAHIAPEIINSDSYSRKTFKRGQGKNGCVIKEERGSKRSDNFPSRAHRVITSFKLEARVAKLEALLLLPTVASTQSSQTPPVETAALQQEVAALKKQLERTNYRLTHLTQAYDQLTKK